jgi:pimeloyl-ACP methyl ester carboxylesterase
VGDLRALLRAFRSAHPLRDIVVDGVRWTYRVGGAGSRTLLLLPGGTYVPDTYFPLIAALESDYRIIAPAYPPVSTMAALTAGAAAILDTEGVRRVAVFGSSYGGYVAQCFVRHFPERVDRLILAQTGLRHFVGARPVRLLARVLRVAPESLVRFSLWRVWSHLFTAPPDERAFWWGLLREILTTQLTRAHIVGLTEALLDFIEHYRFAPGDLAAWPGRVLVLESVHDKAFDAAARAALRTVYPQARVRTFAGAGHTAIITDSAAYIAAIRDFLSETEAHARLGTSDPDSGQAHDETPAPHASRTRPGRLRKPVNPAPAWRPTAVPRTAPVPSERA